MKRNNKLAKTGSVIVLMAVLCVSAVASENTAEDWFKTGQELFWSGSYDDAVKAYDKAIELDPNYGAAWRDKGYSLGSLATFNNDFSRYNESLMAFDMAIELIPPNDTRNLALAWDGKANTLISISYALSDMGQQEEAKSKREEAVNDYSKAIELDPSFTGLEAQLYRAGVLAELDRYDEAVAAYDKIIKTVPDNNTMTMYVAQVWAGKGNVLEKMGDHEDALKAFAKAKELGVLTIAVAQENTTNYWVTKAKDLIMNGSTDEAISAYDRALQIDPSNETIWTYMALELAISGRDDESLRASEKALGILDDKLKVNPQDADSWLRKGRALSSLGRQNESNQAQEMAVQIFNQSIQKDPGNASLWRNMAESLMNLGRWDEGLQALNKVTEIDPKNLDAWERKGEFLTLLSRTNESLQAFDRSLDLIPQNDTKERALVWMAKAQSLSYVDRKEETLAALDKVTELDPSFVVAWRTKGYLLADLGRQNESLAAYEEAIKIDPADALTWSEKGSQLAQLKRYNESLPAFERSLELTAETEHKELAAVWLSKGDALNKTGRLAEALSAFWMSVNESEAALLSDANDTRLLELKGRAFLKLGRYDEAIKTFEQAIAAASPGSLSAPTVWIGKGDVLRAQGRNQEALVAYNQAIDLSPIYPDAWAGRGEAQKAQGLVTEASASFYVARKLGYKE